MLYLFTFTIMKAFILALSFAVSAFAASRMTPPAGALVVAKSGGKYSTVHPTNHTAMK